jgi:WD40 repeat protein
MDSPAGNQVTAPAELRRASQDSVRECVTAAAAPGRSVRRWAVPLAAAAAVAAAACVPVVWPLLAASVGGSDIVGAALVQVGAVGGGLLSEAVIRAWDKLRAGGASDAGQDGLRDALSAELQDGLASDTPAAAALRSEVAGVLRGVEAVQVALTATVEESAAEVRQVLVRGLRELGEEFTEFGWVLDEVNNQLTAVAEDVAQTAATSREVADNQQQTLVELALLRQEARSAFRYSPGGPAAQESSGQETTGQSPDEERAAALDAAGVAVSAHCPYPGLAAFQPADAERFFGREQLTAELVARAGEQLARPGLLMVLGPSGSGKSSLLRAGLLPAIVAGTLPARGSSAWPRDLMTPGRRPLLELATRIASLAGIPAGALEADLRADPARVTAAVRQAMLAHGARTAAAAGTDTVTGEAADPVAGSAGRPHPAAGGPRLVLIVDQFEEVFTQCDDEEERRTFIRALWTAAGAPSAGAATDGRPRHPDAREAPAVVLIGIRADFYARAAAYQELVPYLQDHQVLVGPMGEAGLRAAIERPAAVAGLVVDAALVEVLLADLGRRSETTAAGGDGYEAGRLALLSYALQQTWRNREGRRLTVAGYRATGGIDGAVAQAAEAVYSRLGPAGRDALRRMLLRLVTFGDGTPDTRRRVTLGELAGQADEGSAEAAGAAATRAVLADLIEARLVTADEDSVEITHETLLTAWPRLRGWLTEDRAGLRIHRDLTDAARDWRHENRDPSRLFRGARLAVAADWAARYGPDLNADERAFLAASQHERKRTAQRRRTAVAALAVLTIVSLATTFYARLQQSAAITARDQAVSSQVAAEAGQLAATDPSLAAQLDVAANGISSTPASETRLVDTTAVPLASVLTGPRESVGSVAVSPRGTVMAAGDDNGDVWLWDIADPARVTRLGRPLVIPDNMAYSVAFSPDGRTLAAGTLFGQVVLWNVTDPAHPVKLGPPLAGPRVGVTSVAFSRDSAILAAGGVDGNVWLWDAADPARPVSLGRLPAGPGSVDTVAFSPAAPVLAAGDDDGNVLLWNLSRGTRPVRLGPPVATAAGVVNALAFTPDGRILASGGDDEKVRLWNLANPSRPAQLGQPLTGPAGFVYSVAVSPDGQTLAVGSADDKAWLWNIANPAAATPLSQPLAGDTDIVHSVAFTPDGRTLVTGSDDQTVRLWRLPADLPAAGPVQAVAVSPDGRIVAAGDYTGQVRLGRLTGAGQLAALGRPLTGPQLGVASLAFSHDGRILAAGGGNGTVWLWNLGDPARPVRLGLPLTPRADAIFSLAFSADSRVLAAGTGDEVLLWNITDPARPVPLAPLPTGPRDGVNALAVSKDGRILAAGTSYRGVLLWNFTRPLRPVPLGRPLRGPADIASVAVSSGTGTLAASSGHQVWLWNVANPARPVRLGPALTGPSGNVGSVAFSQSEPVLAAGSDDTRVWLWDLADPARPALIGQPLTGALAAVYAVALSPSGGDLVAGGPGGLVRLWNLNVDDAIARICSATSGSTLTQAQWQQYVPQLPYDPPCASSARYGPLGTVTEPAATPPRPALREHEQRAG